MHTRLSKRSIRPLLAIAATITTSLVLAVAAFPGGDYVAGEVMLHFDPSGHLRLTMGEKLLVDGTFTVEGDHISLTDRSGPMACAKGEETGIYQWKLEHDALTLTKIDDACDGRSGDIAAQPWTRQR